MRIPYALSVHGRRELAAVSRVIQQHRTMLGPETREFEARIAKLFGKRYGVMVNSGSSANLLALDVLSLPPGSEVLTPILTFATTVSPLVHKGLVPVFADVELGSYLINIDQVESLITPRSRALMIPSLIGNVPDMERLRALANRHHLFFIEDSCDTLGATFNGKPTGVYSDISTTSFYGSHVINAAGGGGMMCVNRLDWAQRATVLRGWGRSSSLFGESEDIQRRFRTKVGHIAYDAKFIFTEMGYNFLPLEISAAFGIVQVKRLPEFARERQKIFVRLLRFFSNYTDYFILPRQTPNTQTNWLAFPLTIKKEAPFSRPAIVTYLEKQNIQTRPVFTGNILRQPGFRHISHRGRRASPVADYIMRQAFLIGCHQGLRAADLNYVEETFERFLRRY